MRKFGILAAVAALSLVSAAASAGTTKFVSTANPSNWTASLAPANIGANPSFTPTVVGTVAAFNTAWTGGTQVQTASGSIGAPVTNQQWIAPKFNELAAGDAYNGFIKYTYTINDLVIGNSTKIDYNFAFSSDNRVLKIELVGDVGSINTPSKVIYTDPTNGGIPPGSPNAAYFHQFQGSVDFGGSTTGFVTPPLQIVVTVFNEANLDRHTLIPGSNPATYISPTGLILSAAITVPTPMASMSGMGLLGLTALARRRR